MGETPQMLQLSRNLRNKDAKGKVHKASWAIGVRVPTVNQSRGAPFLLNKLWLKRTLWCLLTMQIYPDSILIFLQGINGVCIFDASFSQNCICWILFGTLTIIFNVVDRLLTGQNSLAWQFSTKSEILTQDHWSRSACHQLKWNLDLLDRPNCMLSTNIKNIKIKLLWNRSSHTLQNFTTI